MHSDIRLIAEEYTKALRKLRFCTAGDSNHFWDMNTGRSVADQHTGEFNEAEGKVKTCPKHRKLDEAKAPAKFFIGQAVKLPNQPSARKARIENVVGRIRGQWMYQVSYEIFDSITPKGSGKRYSQPWMENELEEDELMGEGTLTEKKKRKKRSKMHHRQPKIKMTYEAIEFAPAQKGAYRELYQGYPKLKCKQCHSDLQSWFHDEGYHHLYPIYNDHRPSQPTKRDTIWYQKMMRKWNQEHPRGY